MRWIKFTIIGLLCVLAGTYLHRWTSANTSRPFSTLKLTIRNHTAAGNAWTLYDPNPNHLWNRLYRALYERVTKDGKGYGYDELDPLLWRGTKYLLRSSPSTQQATAVLDEFLSTHAERLISDPTKQALLQRDLWAVFDWTTRVPIQSQEKENLQLRLAKVIKRLALSGDKIKALPNTYDQAIRSKAFAAAYNPSHPEQPFLPPDLFDANGPWVQLSGRDGGLVARGHTDAFPRSVFMVLIRLPEGRTATLTYLNKLAEFPNPWLRDREGPGGMRPNPGLSQFPAGTELALVRLMMLIDNQANLQSTNLIESIQIRTHRVIPNSIDNSRSAARAAMDVDEFRLSRPKLFAGENGGLRALGTEDTEFPIFASHDIDLFEVDFAGASFERMLSAPLEFCAACHSRSGVHSMLSRGGRVVIPSVASDYEAAETKAWKQRQDNWKLLRALWRSD
jgi:hypothetical protein